MALKETLADIFRPEVEESQIKTIRKLKDKGLSSIDIADSLYVDEEYVQEILEIFEDYPEKPSKDVWRMISERKNEGRLHQV